MLHPVDGLRAGQWIEARLEAQGFPHRVPPDVARDILDDLLWPQDVIVIAHLPQA